MTSALVTPLVSMPGGWELVLIVAVIILLFGAAKLPELARGTGQALRIFKSETKGLRDDDKKDNATPAGPAGELNAADRARSDETLAPEVAEGEIVDERDRNA